MGQAKQRVTFEQRQGEAIRREAERMERLRKELDERQEAERRARAASPAQQSAQRRAGGTSRTMLAAAMVALSMGSTPARNIGRQDQDSATSSEGDTNASR